MIKNNKINFSSKDLIINNNDRDLELLMDVFKSNHDSFLSGHLDVETYKNRNISTAEQWNDLTIPLIDENDINRILTEDMKKFISSISCDSYVESIYFNTSSKEFWIVIRDNDINVNRQICKKYFDCCKDYSFSFITAEKEQIILDEFPKELIPIEKKGD